MGQDVWSIQTMTDKPLACTMRIRVLQELRIPASDERYHFKVGQELWMSPTALSRMLRALDQRAPSRTAAYEMLARIQIDKPGELEIGHLYIVSGQGVMKLVNLYQPEPDRTTCSLVTAGYQLNYWADAKDVVREADSEYLSRYIENSRRAGMHASAACVENWMKDQEGNT